MFHICLLETYYYASTIIGKILKPHLLFEINNEQGYEV
jgi:hypothetical protein